MRVHNLVAALIVGCALLFSGQAEAADVSIDIHAQNATSLNLVSYRLGGVTVTTPGAQAATPVTLNATGLATGVQPFETTFGTLMIDVAGNGAVTKVSGPFTIVGSELTIENTVNLGTLTIVPRNPSSYDRIGYELRCIEEGNSDVGPIKYGPGTPVTAVTYPFTGMAPDMDFYVSTSFNSLHFKINAAGALVHGNSSVPGSQIPGELFSISGSTITIENTFGFPTLTIKGERATGVNLFGARITDLAGFGSENGPSAAVPGSAATTGVTLPFAGMPRYASFYLFTTVGLVHLAIDANGDITYGSSSVPGSGSYELFSVAGSTITLKNRAGFPEVRIRTAAPTSVASLTVDLASYEGVYAYTSIGSFQTIPGADAMTGVTFGLSGFLPYHHVSVVTDRYGNPILRFDASGGLVPGVIGNPTLNATLLASGSTVTIQNLLNFGLEVTLDHAAATNVTYELQGHVGGLKQLPAGQTAGSPALEALGMTPLMVVTVATSVGNVVFDLQPDGTAVFRSPATNVTPTKGALSIEGGTNTLFFELKPLAPYVTAVSPQANQLNVNRATNVTVSFSEQVNPATVTAATFRVLDPLGAPVATAAPAVSPSRLQATLNPTAPLAADTLYTVQVTSGVLDTTGTPAIPFTSRFRTALTAGSDGTPLPAVSTPVQPLAAGSAETGHAVAGLGDLNGDGIKDFISGSPGYVVGSGFAPTTATEAGAALVYFGSADPVTRAQPDIIFEGESAHDRAGVSVAGNFDFNGDGIKDIVIGAEQVNRASNPNSPTPTGNGKVYVIFFDPNNCAMNPRHCDPAADIRVDLALVGQPSGIPGVVFTGAAFGDQAGFSVAAGGTSTPGGGTDILIGAPGADPGGRTDAGAAYVVFDSATLSGNVSLTRISSGLLDQVPGKAYLGEAAGDNLGFSTAFGGDIVQGQTAGTGTVLMGAPAASGSRGKVIAPPGDPDTTPIIVDAVGVGVGHLGLQIRGTQVGEQLGFAVANGGDALVDGVPDLLIGAPFHDVGANLEAGAVFQISSVMASGPHDVTAVGVTIAGVTWQGAASGDQLGFAVAGVGDVTGDGYDDVVFGAPYADAGAIAEAGAAYVVNGQPLAAVTQGTINVSAIGVDYPGTVLTGTTVGEHAGSALAGGGDLDDDGDPDFVVGAPGLDGQIDLDAGTAYAVGASQPPPPGNCGPNAACFVSDLSNGAQLQAPVGAVAAPATIGVTGILVAGSLPGPVPSGTLLLGAATFEPEGQAFLSPYATLHLPTVAALESQLTNLESLPLSYWSGSSWVSAGFNGTVVTNPQYAQRKAVRAVASVAHVYAVFLNDTDGDGIWDAHDNCPSVANALQQNADGDGLGDVCDLCTDTDGDGFGNPGFAANSCPLDNCPVTSNPTQSDADGDGVGDPCDDCPFVPNPSQSDIDNDNVGDACDTDPRLSVSTNPADVHDFTTIQAAVNAAVQSGTRIRILPGAGPYLESVVVNRNFAFIFEGVDDIAHTPVVVDGGGGIAFDVVTTSAGGRVSFDNLTIRGATGIRSAVSTAMEDLTFEQATALAVDLNGGTHVVDRIRMGSTVASGIDTVSGVTLTLRNSRFESLSGTALRLGGSSTVETVLIGGGAGDAAVVLSGASLSLRHATIAGNGGKGVDNSAGGAATIAYAIVQDNAGGDVANVACPSITWSNVKSQDCTATGNDLQTTCSLGADFRQLVSSSCLDYDPSPAAYSGAPCLDLDNGPRLRDHDGNGFATIDPGAFERENTTLTPANVPNLRFTSKTTLAWDAEPSGLATEYHVYRDLKSNLSYGNFGVCHDELDSNRTDLVLTDASVPPPGQSFVYVITAGRPAAGTQPDREGTMGLDRCMERSNFNACP